jgi:SAM-dependent methyltransferase
MEDCLVTSSPFSQDDAMVVCPVCQSTSTGAYVAKNGYAFYRCSGCTYIFCHPRPSQEELATLYGAGEGGGGTITCTHYPKASSRRRRGFFNALKLLPHVWNKRVLDVGCGGGFVVAGMKRIGAREAVGIDIGPAAIDYARAHYPGCVFHCGPLEACADSGLSPFDFVYSSEVIEHVNDVEAYMRFLAEVTKINGKVFITTPDIGSPLVPEDVTAWDVFSPPLHIQFFTKATLVRLFERFGFAPLRHIADRRGAGLKVLFRKTGDF